LAEAYGYVWNDEVFYILHYKLGELISIHNSPYAFSQDKVYKLFNGTLYTIKDTQRREKLKQL
jgi:hypothetical protein